MGRIRLAQEMYNRYVLFSLILLSMISATFCARPPIVECISADCIELTAKVAASVDWNAKPCDDFYEHACGLWSQNQTIPNPLDSWNNLDIVLNRVRHQVHDLLTDPNFDSKDLLEQNAKLAYETCNNLAKIEEFGIPILLSVTQEAGGWPMIMSSHQRVNCEDNWQYAHVIYGAMTGAGALLTINVEEDWSKNGEPTLYLDQPKTLFKGVNNLEDEKDEEEYKDFLKTVLEVFHDYSGESKPNPFSIQIDITKLVDFRYALKETMTRGLKSRDIRRKNNPKTIKKLQEWNEKLGKDSKAVVINWKSFIEATFQFARDVHISEKQIIIIHETGYLEKLLNLLAKTEPEVIVNHIHLSFVENHLQYAGTKMKSLVSSIHHRRKYVPDNENRWEKCIETHPMKHVLSNMYVKKYFPDSAGVELKQVMSKIHKTSIEEIKNSPWLKKSVINKAVKKLEDMYMILGYPNWYIDAAAMNKYYDNQEVSDEYMFNVLNYGRAAYSRQIEKLSSTSLLEVVESYAIVPRIVYVTTKNAISITAGALQQPFFGREMPGVIQYATTGDVLAHEISHAFDPNGIFYNEKGQREDWWDEKTKHKYYDRVDCITNQYRGIHIKEAANIHPLLRPNSALTSDEDFADNLALQVAYTTFKMAAGDVNGKTAAAPMLRELKDSQLFFYVFAQMHCEHLTEEHIIESVRSNHHSIGYLRVNGPLQNSPEFSEAFGCPTNSFMNPPNKCFIWKQ